MEYGKLKDIFKKHEKSRPEKHLSAHIVFTEDSFPETYSRERRTYLVSSYNKAYMPNMGGYSVIGSCIDGSDPVVRLEAYMADEHGGQNGWRIEDCYLVD